MLGWLTVVYLEKNDDLAPIDHCGLVTYFHMHISTRESYSHGYK